MTDLRTDILPDELTQEESRIIVRRQFDAILGASKSQPDRSQTPGLAKNINEFYELVKLVIDDYNTKAKKTSDSQVFFTQEKPDVVQELPAVTFTLTRREPGRYSEGRPFEGDVRNLRPLLREEKVDPNNLGYRLAVFGYWHDNIVRFTVWARTNKEANEKALWFEGLMEDYQWFFRVRGVNRMLYWGRGSDEVYDAGGSARGVSTNKLYGRPIDYFVRTETLRSVSEKEIERIIINLH